jgi:hypothetical protein
MCVWVWVRGCVIEHTRRAHDGKDLTGLHVPRNITKQTLGRGLLSLWYFITHILERHHHGGRAFRGKGLDRKLINYKYEWFLLMKEEMK